MRNSMKILSVLTLALCVAGCGHKPSDRALSGAAIGAGVGAAGTAIVGGPVIAGAAAGAVVGGATGALTKPKHINLGKPIWR